MFPGVGTVINIATIIAGAGLGVMVGSKMKSELRTLITDVLGLTTLLGGAAALAPYWSNRYTDSLPKGWALLAVWLHCLLVA